MNEHGDFFPATPANVFRHWRRRFHDKLHPLWATASGAFRSWLCAPGRFLFERLHGAESLEIVVPSVSGHDVVEWKQHDRLWRYDDFERFLQNSNTRWILWTYEDAPPAPEMSRLHIQDPLAFVVSRQDKFRHWRRTLFARVPFRKLQPGAASQVLAPLASSMLIDRAKLLALGLPKVRYSYVAWMILFWKAAAAGWRSYSIGSDAPCVQRRDFPFLEACLVWNFLTQPELRRLGPQNSALSRGTIAFAPLLQSSLRPSSKLRVLILSPFLPFPLSHGGAVRIYNLCRALRDRVDFSLVAVREFMQFTAYADLHEVFAQVHVVDLEEAPNRDRGLPKQVRQHCSTAIEALLQKLDREWRQDLLQIEYTHMAQFRNALPNTPAILVEHDITHTLYRQLATHTRSLAAEAEYLRWLFFERHALSTFDGVWTVSERDHSRASAHRAPESTFTVPNGVDIEWYRPSPLPAASEEILFVGSLRHRPNLLALEWLRDEIMPKLWTHRPSLRLSVAAGPDFEKYLKGVRLDPRIVLHGFSADIRPLYERSSVAVVPLLVSAGTNIKLLEAMASGRPVVSTTPGCQGLHLRDGDEILIRDDADSFAAATLELLANRSLAESLTQRARQCAESRWSWQAQADLAYASYLALSGNAGRPACANRASTAKPPTSRSQR